jgi:hypothetical protein
VKVRPWRDEVPNTVNVEVTVEEAPTKPPKSESVLFVRAPLEVMVARVAVVAAIPGQFVPFARQTEDPPREIDPPVMVTLPLVRDWKFPVVAEAVPAVSEVPEAVAKPNQPVLVPFVKVRVWRPVVPVTVRFVMFAVKRLLVFAKRFVDVALVPVCVVYVRDWRPVVPVTVRFVTLELRTLELFAKKLVLVTFVPVPLVKVRVLGEKFVAVRFVMMAVVAKSAVVVAFVDVTFVKTPVLGVVAPMVELLIVPPEMVSASVTKASVMEFVGSER